MIPFSEIFLDCHDAKVFQDKRNHHVLSAIFFRDAHSEQALDHQRCFIIGEKGTGKTIIAQYITNVITEPTKSTIVDFSSIDFQTFRNMYEEGFLKLVPLDQIWQLLLLLIVSEKINRDEKSIFGFPRFKIMHELIQRFYDERFQPEFPIAIQFLTKIKGAAELSAAKLAKFKGQYSDQISGTMQNLESPLNSLLRDFQNAIASTRLLHDHIVFVDGIDVKPDEVNFDKYIQALRAFARSVMYLNFEVFAKMKGKGRIKICLLLRPDIFDKLNLQNQSARVSDNSVVLKWDCTYDNHRYSNLFELSDRVLGRQNYADLARGAAWDHYISPEIFRYYASGAENRSFTEFLRLSWFRPRDIIMLLNICQKKLLNRDDILTKTTFEGSRKGFSDYLYGEVRDFSRFYFSDETFRIIERFFAEVSQFDDFNYQTFMKAHEILMKKLIDEGRDMSVDYRIKSPDEFLQILYSSNIICWREWGRSGKVEDHWAFRERTPSQLEPQVGYYSDYAVHYGLRRALRVNHKMVIGVRDLENKYE